MPMNVLRLGIRRGHLFYILVYSVELIYYFILLTVKYCAVVQQHRLMLGGGCSWVPGGFLGQSLLGMCCCLSEPLPNYSLFCSHL